MYILNCNCFNIGNSYFYFDEFNNYHRDNDCPINYDKMIIEKNKCIDECKKDDKYKYEYNKTCYEYFPNRTYHIFNYHC